MTITTDQLIERLKLRRDDCEVVDDNVLRVIRQADGRPYAVCVFDTRDELPESRDALTAYQDRILGRKYFDDRRSLQWNNYLYFVLSADRAKRATAGGQTSWIEQDRAYARKYVIRDDHIESVFAPTFIRDAVATPQVNILNEWTRLLDEAQLQEIVLSTNSYPQRIAAIENGEVPPPKRSRDATSTQSPRSTAFIKSFTLVEFRPLPRKREFAFGKVNLLVGANGTGKTSLLEAIELLYCGRTKRNPNVNEKYRLIATYGDDITESVTAKREPALFRACNAAWYGQKELKTNNLYLSFSQFNFLDTDAAVGFAEASGQLEENLSKLLVGSDTSRVWKDIEDVRSRIAGRIRELEPLQKHIVDDLDAIASALAQPVNVQRESDSLKSKVREMVSALGWPASLSEWEDSAHVLTTTLAELQSLCEQALKCEWVSSPVTLRSISDYIATANIAARTSAVLLTELTATREQIAEAVNATKLHEDAGTLVSEASHIMTSNVITISEQLKVVRQEVFEKTRALGTIDNDLLKTLRQAPEFKDATLAACDEILVKAHTSAEAAHLQAADAYNSFSQDRDRMSSLAVELREIARRLIAEQIDPDECPLCHTHLSSGELAQHVSEVQGSPLDHRGQELLAAQRDATAALDRIGTLEQGITLLTKARSNTEPERSDETVEGALTGIREMQRSLERALATEKQLTSEIAALATLGLTVERSVEIDQLLASAGVTIAPWDDDVIAKTALMCKQAQEDAQKRVLSTRAKEREILGRIWSALGLPTDDSDNVDHHLSNLSERRAITELLRDKLVAALEITPWPLDRPLSELLIESEAVRQLVSRCEIAANEERSADTAVAQHKERQAKLQGELSEITPKLDRLRRAQAVLETLHSEYSLNSAAENTLKRNRKAIDAIFSRIHAPAEFSGLGNDVATLIREGDNVETQLSQISTGQRAAFALSVFLSQNLQLRDAPPVVLIDDPIAHVDDLNALSFLDFLRELALAGERQLFFATADDRLASLFERKFDFLGNNDFCRFELTR